MKTFETPYVDVKKFDVEDILTASGEPAEEEDPLQGMVLVGENCA